MKDRNRILVVEDEPIVAADIKARLELLGYQAAGTASTGEKAVALAGELRPDLVLMDIQLQNGMDGIEAAQRIRERWHLPVVFLTAYSEDATLERAKFAEPFGYLLKPFEDRELKTAIEIALFKHGAELELQASEERYRALVNNMTDIIYSVSSEGTIRFIGPQVQRYGFAVNELVSRPFADFVSLEDCPALLRNFEQTVTTGAETQSSFRIVCRDGRMAWFEAVARPVRDGAGKIAAVMGVLRDITERKRAEQENALLAQTLKSAQDCISVTDLQNRILFVNQALLDTYGYAENELLGRDVRMLRSVPPAAEPAKDEVWLSTLQGEWHGEVMNRHKDGTEFPIELWTSLVKDNSGTPTAMVGVARDITQRKRAEQAVQESEEKFRVLFRESADANFLLEQGVFFDCNEAALRLLARRREDVLGRRPDQLSPALQSDGESSSEKAARIIAQTLGEGSSRFEWTHQRIDGTHIEAEVVLTAIRLEGRPILHATVRDVSERKRAELERQRLQAQLVQAQKMEAIGTLAGGIAHDFNNILGAIICYAELAWLDASADAKLKDSLENILKASERAKNLVQQILSFSRRTKQERKPLGLSSVVREALKLLRASLPTTIEIVTNIPGHLPQVLADPTQIHQVLMNLCTNAAHAMRDRVGRLEVRVEPFQVNAEFISTHPDLREGNYVKLSVSDTGHGMDEVVLKRLFEPFFTTKGPGEGTGLGLSVVHGIVRDHDGGIYVYSQPGKGTMFHLYFPAIEEPEAETSPVQAKPPTGQGERILFVDDELPLCQMAERALQLLNYRPTTCSDPRRALELFLSQPAAFDLIITDLTMPHMTGMDLAGAILQKHPATPILLSSGFSGTWTTEAVQRLGLRGLVMKPLNLVTFGQAIQQILHGVPAAADDSPLRS